MKKELLALILVLFFLTSCKPLVKDEIERNKQYIYEDPFANQQEENLTLLPEEPIPQQVNTTQNETIEEVVIATEPKKKEFFMTASQWKFKPDSIVVEEGDEVTIYLTSLDINDLFEIPDFGISVDLEPQSKREIKFTVNKTGKYKFWCKGDCSNITDMKGFIYVK